MNKKVNKRGQGKRIAEELAQRMLSGERISIDEYEQYFEPATDLAGLRAKGRFAGLIQQACRIVEGKHGEGEMAGSLGDKTWGIPVNGEEVSVVLAGKYFQLMGRNNQARKWVAWTQKKGVELSGLSDVLG